MTNKNTTLTYRIYNTHYTYTIQHSNSYIVCLLLEKSVNTKSAGKICNSSVLTPWPAVCGVGYGWSTFNRIYIRTTHLELCVFFLVSPSNRALRSELIGWLLRLLTRFFHITTCCNAYSKDVHWNRKHPTVESVLLSLMDTRTNRELHFIQSGPDKRPKALTHTRWVINRQL